MMMRTVITAAVVVMVALTARAQSQNEFRAKIRKDGQSLMVEHRSGTSYEARRELEAIYGKGSVEYMYQVPRSTGTSREKEKVW